MVWIDVSAAVLQRAGVARYAGELARALVETADAEQSRRLGFYACGTSRQPADLAGAPFRSTRLSPKLWRAALLAGHIARRTVLPGLRHFDLFHATDIAYPFAEPEQVIVTVHDLSVLRYPQYHSPLNRVFQTIMLRLLRVRRHQIVAVSRFTAREIETLLGIESERIHVIYPGVAPVFFDVPSAEEVAAVRQKYGLKRPFVLSVGTLEPRKNIAGLTEAFVQVARPDVELLIVGANGWGTSPFAAAAATGRVRTRWLGFVPDCDLRCLYRDAAVFVFPSLYEGFGSPVAEAAVCGATVICSSRCGAVELDPHVVRIDPDDSDELKSALSAALEPADSGGRSGISQRSIFGDYSHAARMVWLRYGEGAAPPTVAATV